MIVSALQEPAFRPGLVDRLLIMAEQENLQAVIVLNKLDLDRQQGERYRLLYSGLGYPTFLTSTVTGLGVPELRSQLAGRSALCGHSGVGKSSLLRALAPELTPQTGEVSLANNKGQHTTTSVRLYSTEWGEIFDLPGLKLAPLTMEPTPTGAIFPNLAPVGVGFVTACTVRKAGAGSWLLWRAASWIRSGMIPTYAS